MKKCIVISDSFKGTLSSIDICHIAKESIAQIFPNCEVIAIPIADGGEGTVECFQMALHGTPVNTIVSGPFGEAVEITYVRSGTKAVIEMACAAGLPMVKNRSNPETTTTYGVGQVIRHVIKCGCTEILLGLGGSATNDGGCGCAAALGVKFYDKAGNTFVPLGKNLDQICRIDTSETKRLLDGIHITAMCDVENPLYGQTGAAYVFAPQKGADNMMVERLDHQLQQLDLSIQRELGLFLADVPGAGAAGGMGAGCIAFLGATLKAGIEATLDVVGFDNHLSGADLVITGEGRIDAQSIHGKVISGIAKRIKNTPLIAIVGSIDDSASSAYDIGVTAMFGINREAMDFEKSAHKTKTNYSRTLEDILRLMRAIET